MKSILVHERSGEWSPALRRCDASRSVAVTTLADWNGLLHRLRKDTASFVVLEPDPDDAAQTARDLFQLRRDFPKSQFVVVTENESALNLMLEAGAAWVATCPWKLSPVLRMAKRHFHLHPDAPETTYEKIWNSLPWQS